MKNISSAKLGYRLTWQKSLLQCLMPFALALTLWGCSKTTTPSAIPSDTTIQPSLTTTVEGLLPDSYLTKETVQKIFALAGDYLIHEGSNESIEFACTITEGRFCWFSEEDLGGKLYGNITKDLSIKIIEEIKAEIIEQAEQNVLHVRCTKPNSSDWPLTCEGNWGWTEIWRPIEVR
jgi:hypothetical protein